MRAINKLINLALLVLLSHPTISLSQLLKDFSSVDSNSAIVIHDGYSGIDSANYFGFTVSLAQEITTSSSSGWVFIGAPKSNLTNDQRSTSYFEPGYIWRCKLSTGDPKCEILHFTDQLCEDKTSNRDDGTCDSNFMGGSLTFNNEVFVSCAPTWRRKKRNPTLGLRMDGACYWMSKATALRTELPNVLNRNQPSQNPIRTDRGSLIPFQQLEFNNPGYLSISGIPRWYFAESGFSAHIARNRDVLIGAPGVVGWSGSLIKLDSRGSYNQWGFTNVERYGVRNINYLNLFGYAVTSGNYFRRNEILFAASSPRAEARIITSYGDRSVQDILGAVLIIKAESLTRNSYYNPHLEEYRRDIWYDEFAIKGEQFGSYFGASLESVDINGDGFDDLLVGAPLMDTHRVRVNSSIAGDHGCIYIYTAQRGRNRFGEVLKRECGDAPGGRFGTSIAQLGDLNQDDYNDFAVGAPYEENGGAVYIFYGARDSNFKRLRISGQEYQSKFAFSAFGYSIAGNVDLDGNGTPDFSVGSYLSKHVVIFRTRPQMKIKSEIKFYEQGRLRNSLILEKNATDFRIQMCTNFNIKSNKNVNVRHQGEIVIWAKLIIDEDEKRFFIGSSSTVSMTFVFQQGVTRTCKDFTITRRTPPEDLIHDQNEVSLTPVLWYNATSNKTVGTLRISKVNGGEPLVVPEGSSYTDFCSYCPYPIMFEPQSSEISFRRDCKRRGEAGNFPVCKPVLRVTLKGRYGEDRNPSRRVENGTKLVFGDTPWLALQVAVKNENQTAYFTVIKISWKWENAPTLTVPHLTVGNSQCNVDRENFTATCDLDRVRSYLGKDQEKSLEFLFNMNDVTAVMSDPMRLKIDVEVALEQDNQFKPVQTSFLLNYQVNTALDRMEGALYNVSLGSTSTLFYNFKIIIPGTSPTRLYLKFLLPESINYEGRKTEIFDIEIAGPLGLSCNDVSNETMAHPEFGIYDQHLKQKNVFTTAKLGRAYDINNCKALHCNVLVTRNTRVLDLSFRVKPLDKDLTRRILQKDGVLDFDGFGHARILEKLTTFNFSRIIINPPEPSEIAAWIIIAAAAGGLIILFLFVVCLCKCGFFRRNAKEKLALLKAEVDAEDTELTIQNRYEDTSPQVTPSA